MIQLTRRQEEVYKLMLTGMATKQIARELGVVKGALNNTIMILAEKGFVKKIDGRWQASETPYDVDTTKIELTKRQAEIYELILAGAKRSEIRKACHNSSSAVSSFFRALVNRGVLIRTGHDTYEAIPKEYVIVSNAEMKPICKTAPRYTDHLPQDLIDYIKGHYKLYERKRGELAKKLGITRTLLNQIALEHKLAKGG